MERCRCRGMEKKTMTDHIQIGCLILRDLEFPQSTCLHKKWKKQQRHDKVVFGTRSFPLPLTETWRGNTDREKRIRKEQTCHLFYETQQYDIFFLFFRYFQSYHRLGFNFVTSCFNKSLHRPCHREHGLCT